MQALSLVAFFVLQEFSNDIFYQLGL